MVLVIMCAKVGPAASDCASLIASASSASGATSRLKKPQRSASSAFMVRPVNRSSAARPCPITRGSMAQAPISQPARPTRVKRKAVFAFAVPMRMSENSAIIAPAPTQTPSTAAITGCGQARIALTRSPVMRVNSRRPFMSRSNSGPMMSRTSPPEQKLPPFEPNTIAFTSSAPTSLRKVSRSSA